MHFENKPTELSEKRIITKHEQHASAVPCLKNWKMVNIEILQYIWNTAPGDRYIPFISYFHCNEIFRASDWSGIWAVELARPWKEHGQAPSQRKEKVGKVRCGISELPVFTGSETEAPVNQQVQICASMKCSNGKRERILLQNHGFHPYFSLRSEKLHRFRTSEHTGEKPPHLPDCVLITTGVYLVWIFISNSLLWSLSERRHFQQMHLFTCLSREGQPTFSPVFS